MIAGLRPHDWRDRQRARPSGVAPAVRSAERGALARAGRAALQAQAAGSVFGVANNSQALPAPIRQAMPSGRMLTSVQVLVLVAA